MFFNHRAVRRVDRTDGEATESSKETSIDWFFRSSARFFLFLFFMVTISDVMFIVFRVHGSSTVLTGCDILTHFQSCEEVFVCRHVLQLVQKPLRLVLVNYRSLAAILGEHHIVPCPKVAGSDLLELAPGYVPPEVEHVVERDLGNQDHKQVHSVCLFKAK